MNNNNDDFELEWSAGGQEPVPEGIYDASFEGFEIKPKREWNGKEMDEGIQFRFKVSSGAQKDKLTSNIGSLKPTPNNVSGRIIKGSCPL